MSVGAKLAGPALLLWTCFMAAAPAYPAQQKGEVIDRIVAVVEDNVVLESELELELKRYMLQAQRKTLTSDEQSNLRQEILDGLIADLLMTVHAAREGIEVSDDEVDLDVERAIEDNRRALGGDEEFSKQLELEGMTLEQLRSLYHEKLKARRLVERLYREVLSEVQVTEGEVRRYFKEHASELPKRPVTVSLAHILIIPKTSSSVKERALERVREIEKKVRGGMDFTELAKEYSEGPSAKYGGSLGYIRLDDLNNPEFEAAVRELTVGDVSGPVLTEFGYHIIKLEDVSGDKVLVRHILVKVESGEKDLANALELAERIRGELVEGADFAEMAAEYSDDHATSGSGGVVGEIPVSNLPEFFRDIIEGVGEGEIAPVIKEKKGFRIVKVLGRSAERDYSFNEAREELRRLIEHQRLQERIKGYVDELKNIYYVEVKGDL